MRSKIDSYSRTKTLTITDDHYHYQFQTGEDIDAVRIELELDKETCNLFTDLVVVIMDQDETFMENEGFDQRKLQVEFHPPKLGKYSLKILAGFTFLLKKRKPGRLV